jgi:hypothetical protein
MSKIFGDFNNLQDLNETARNLREAQEYDELLVLGLENGFDEDTVKKFYEGDSQFLIEEQEPVQKCRVCGCSWNNPCEGGCYWVEPDLCSKCAEEMKTATADTKEKQEPQTETAEEKLKNEAGTAKNDTVPTQPISKHLIAKCKEDAEFAKLVLQPHKTLEKCFNHVESEARKKLNNRTGWIDDNEVYAWAEDYYRLDDAELERIKAENKKKEEEKRKKEAEKAKSAPAVKKSTPTKEEPKKVEAAPPREKAKKSKHEPEGQLSLFDFGGVGVE